MISRQTLSARTLPSGLQQTMSLAIQAGHFVNSSALNTKIINKLCSEMDAASTELLLHIELKGLLKNKVLKHMTCMKK
jgi:hypothetical protein